jgi:hypothetical protein
MADSKREEDLLRLNALVDGELDTAERATMAARIASDRDLARTHATLSRLKAVVAEMATDKTGIVLPRSVLPRSQIRRRILPAAAALLFAVAGSWALWVGPERLERSDISARPEAVAVTLAALPAGTSVPVLDGAGLQLIGVTVQQAGDTPVLRANYRGPHGCRLELRAYRGDAILPAAQATIHRAWRVADVAYELDGHGMPAWRFAIIAEAAERQTRRESIPKAIEHGLREARLGAPPCTG